MSIQAATYLHYGSGFFSRSGEKQRLIDWMADWIDAAEMQDTPMAKIISLSSLFSVRRNV